MYNKGLYNRTGYNLTLSDFIWQAVAYASSVGEGALFITRRLAASVAAETSQTSALTRIYFFDGYAEAETVVEGNYIRVRFFASVAEAVSYAEANGVKTYIKDVMSIPTVNMVAGDVLIIDTDAMTVTLNGTSILDKVSDDSVFFALKFGGNALSVDGAGTADIKVAYKDRWL
jgi:hypothetical protein